MERDNTVCPDPFFLESSPANIGALGAFTACPGPSEEPTPAWSFSINLHARHCYAQETAHQWRRRDPQAGYQVIAKHRKHTARFEVAPTGELQADNGGGGTHKAAQTAYSGLTQKRRLYTLSGSFNGLQRLLRGGGGLLQHIGGSRPTDKEAPAIGRKVLL